MLKLSSGPSTIVSAHQLDLLPDAPRDQDGFSAIHLPSDEQVLLQGDFSGFHLYLIVVHSRFLVVPGSVRMHAGGRFSAEVYYEANDIRWHSVKLWFHCPFGSVASVRECTFAAHSDAFEFRLGDGKSIKVHCSLTFLTQYCTRKLSIPAKVEYIGIAAKQGREAHMRLVAGHEKLQKILADVNNRHPFRTVSIFLYKPGPLEGEAVSYQDIVETLEASLISHFQTNIYNSEHLAFPNNRTKLTDTLKRIGVVQVVSQLTSPDGVAIYSDTITTAQKEHVIQLTL